ncbi:hypothetical protein [Burkholderia gladioli]|uniref:hypothetical protein n=1 Tax=Burkholderia gladioli TaxID=28095 RepID=UPI00163F391B|nr:hypothetical protein [Burkholderia gladioli]
MPITNSTTCPQIADLDNSVIEQHGQVVEARPQTDKHFALLDGKGLRDAAIIRPLLTAVPNMGTI